MQTILDAGWVEKKLPRRRRDTHKGTYGTLDIVAGSLLYRGAAVLAAAGAARAGTGIVRVCSVEAVCAAVAAHLPGCILQPLAASRQGGVAGGQLKLVLASAGDVLLAGPGLTTTADSRFLIEGILQNENRPLLLDADALNILAGKTEGETSPRRREKCLRLLQRYKYPVVLTPHAGEMARLCGGTVQHVLENQTATAQQFAEKYGCIVVLKSSTTVVAAPCGDVWVNNSAGGPGLAKGGSGDVLAGIIAGLLAQGLDACIAAACGVWLHAAAGDVAAQKYGQAGLSPADLPLALCDVLRRMNR